MTKLEEIFGLGCQLRRDSTACGLRVSLSTARKGRIYLSLLTRCDGAEIYFSPAIRHTHRNRRALRSRLFLPLPISPQRLLFLPFYNPLYFLLLYPIAIMSGDKMEVEAAEQKMNSMEHSEQHYFKR